MLDQLIQCSDARQLVVPQPYVKETFSQEQGVDHGERIAAQVFYQTGRTWQAREWLLGRFREMKLQHTQYHLPKAGEIAPLDKGNIAIGDVGWESRELVDGALFRFSGGNHTGILESSGEKRA